MKNLLFTIAMLFITLIGNSQIRDNSLNNEYDISKKIFYDFISNKISIIDNPNPQLNYLKRDFKLLRYGDISTIKLICKDIADKYKLKRKILENDKNLFIIEYEYEVNSNLYKTKIEALDLDNGSFEIYIRTEDYELYRNL